jgi:hypothetical protein
MRRISMRFGKNPNEPETGANLRQHEVYEDTDGSARKGSVARNPGNGSRTATALSRAGRARRSSSPKALIPTAPTRSRA